MGRILPISSVHSNGVVANTVVFAEHLDLVEEIRNVYGIHISDVRTILLWNDDNERLVGVVGKHRA